LNTQRTGQRQAPLERGGGTMKSTNGKLDLTLEVIKLSSAAALILAGLVSIIAQTVGFVA
jgi:hypothetical protein